MAEQASNPTTTKKKSKGPIRFEAIIPFTIVAVVIWAYFHFLFDRNLKSVLEMAGYQIVGAEVNIASLETSFWKANLRIQGIEVTNSEKPSHNSIKIGDIRFGLLWDGLLRARFVVNEMAVEQIEFATQRKRPGKVKPPEPPKKDSDEPSALEKEANKLKDKALEKTQEKYSENLLGDIAAMLGGTSADDQLKNIENSLPSKQKLKEFETDLKSKQAKWNEKIKTLPQGKEIQAIGDRLSKVKTKDFKSPQELQDSLQQVDAIFKDADAKIKTLQAANDEFNTDIKTLEKNFKELDALVKKDIKDLEARFKIPKLDAKSLTQGLFKQYMDPYLNMFNKYKALADKYVPPNLMKKGKPAPEDEIKPHPRAKGVTYEFGRKNAYPLFWVKRISVSSQAGETKEAGNIKGLITDITSNQKLIGKPTVASVEGGFPALEISGLAAKLIIDVTKEESEVKYDFAIGSYPIEGRSVLSSPDASIAFNKAMGSLKSSGTLLGLNDFKFTLNNQMQKIDYQISAKNEVIDSILKEVFKSIPIITLDAGGRGELPDHIALDLESNLGPELQKGFEKQIQKKIEEAKVKLQAAIDEAIGKEKVKIEAEYNKLKSQIEGEIKKLNDQVNAQKKQAEAKAEQAKKDVEAQANRAKKEAEDKAKKSLEQEGKKAVDDLKKKLGF
jgi:uncharacterized protein (TIGR03545 family)